ncbi:Aste57867_3435 [Aphanomyces stellatus]|uniref:Aste57867_3435 protein n=1 Tax=Aphanomyces stellatus TaxID=120398 RepID=A0A485KC35_9STRA|nr:hypothetical protein As57867_003425 [Aphanomyces stellatus]VFT80601.1 Aste57867_3435 [Aphanomyces stellatus]
MRRHAFCRINGVWHHGQVSAYAPCARTVNLTTSSSSIYPNTPESSLELYAMHNTIIKPAVRGMTDTDATCDIASTQVLSFLDDEALHQKASLTFQVPFKQHRPPKLPSPWTTHKTPRTLKPHRVRLLVCTNWMYVTRLTSPTSAQNRPNWRSLRPRCRRQYTVLRSIVFPPMALIRTTPQYIIFTYLYDISFASGCLTLAHFSPITDHERRTWNSFGTVNPRNFSAAIVPPRAAPLITAQAVLEALDTLDNFFAPFAYGSIVASEFFGRAKRFCLGLHRRYPFNPLTISVIVAFLDDIFGTSTIASVVLHDRRPPHHVNSYLTFDINGPATYQLLMSLSCCRFPPRATFTSHNCRPASRPSYNITRRRHASASLRKSTPTSPQSTGPWLKEHGTESLYQLLDNLKVKVNVAFYCIFANETQVQVFLETYYPTLWRHREVVRFASKLGSLELVQIFYKCIPSDTTMFWILERAAKFGHLNIVEYYFDTIVMGEPKMEAQQAVYVGLINAGLYGHVEIVELLLPFSDSDSQVTAMNLTRLHKRGNTVRTLLDQEPHNQHFLKLLVEFACDKDRVYIAQQFFFHQDGTWRYEQRYYDACFRQAVKRGSVGVASRIHELTLAKLSWIF